MAMIDIIIPTFGANTRLAHTLSALDRCTDIEFIRNIIVVENGNKFGAESTCERFQRLKIKYVYRPEKGAVQARNTGIRESTATHILFMDDDIELNENTITAYRLGIEKYGAKHYFSGPLVPKYERRPPVWLIEFLPWSAKNYTLGNIEKKIDYPGFLGGNICIPSDGVATAGNYEGPGAIGINAGGVGEETRLQERLLANGFTAIWLPGAVGYHWIPQNKCDTNFAIQRAYRHGFTDAINDSSDYPRFFGAPRWLYRRLFFEYLSLIRVSLTSGGIESSLWQRSKVSRTRGMISGYHQNANRSRNV